MDDHQPYNIILAGAYGVGKTSAFRQLSGEVHADHVYTTLGRSAGCQESSKHLDRWSHSALVQGDNINVRSGEMVWSGTRYLRLVSAKQV